MGTLPRVKRGHFVGVNVDTDDVVSDIGQTCPSYQANIASAKDSDVHIFEVSAFSALAGMCVPRLLVNLCFENALEVFDGGQ